MTAFADRCRRASSLNIKYIIIAHSFLFIIQYTTIQALCHTCMRLIQWCQCQHWLQQWFQYNSSYNLFTLCGHKLKNLIKFQSTWCSLPHCQPSDSQQLLQAQSDLDKGVPTLWPSDIFVSCAVISVPCLQTATACICVCSTDNVQNSTSSTLHFLSHGNGQGHDSLA